MASVSNESSAERGQNQQMTTSQPQLWVSYSLMAVNVVMYLLQTVVGPQFTENGWLDGFDVTDGELWRVVTAGFLHG